MGSWDVCGSKSVKSIKYTTLLGDAKAGWSHSVQLITHTYGNTGPSANARDKGGNQGLFRGPWDKKK